MADEAPVEGQAPAADEGQAPTTPPVTGGESSQSQMSLEDALAALKKAREEAASHRVKARELDELKSRIENEKLSETEKLTKRAAEAERINADLVRELQEARIANTIERESTRLGIIDPDAAIRLLDWAEIEFDDAGKPKNVAKLLEGLVKARPWLAQAQRPAANSGGAANPGRSATSTGSQLSWEVIGKMTPDEYRGRRSEIQDWITKNPQPRR